MKQLTIGNVTLDNSYILGPMAGVTDLPFRLLCKEQGAGLLCMEMVSAKGILYHNKNTENLLTIDPKEVPVSLQNHTPVLRGVPECSVLTLLPVFSGNPESVWRLLLPAPRS